EACLEAIAMALDRPMTLFQLQSPVPFAAEPDTEGLSSGLCTGFSTLDFDDQPVTDAIFAQAKLTLVHVWGISCIPNLKDLQTMDEIARVYAPQGVQVLGVPCDITFSDGTRNAQAFKDARALASQAKAHHRQLVPDAVLHRMLQETTIVPTVYFVDAKGCLLGPGITGSREWSEWITLLDAALQSTLEESEPAGGA
ncbi:MAG: TlpA disulfide reductase family protein, partial [Clostridia bacterium]